MRSLYFVPAYLPERERRLIYRPKNKQYLESFPQTYQMGDEDIPLQWIDRQKEIPARKSIINNILRLMREGERREWNNLPSLLEGLQQCLRSAGSTKTDKIDFAKIVRLALLSHRMSIVLDCLVKSEKTGLTLQDGDVMGEVFWGLRSIPQKRGWSEGAMNKALEHAKRVANLLETEKHRASHAPNSASMLDGRARPEVVGVLLELVAVQAYQHFDGQDTDGSVRAYAERLLRNLDSSKSVSVVRKPHVCGVQQLTIRFLAKP